MPSSDTAVFATDSDDYVFITVPLQSLRTLDQFENPKELLYALSDAIAQHQKRWFASAHLNINLDTIRIGNTHGPLGTRGVLVDNYESFHATSPVAFRSVRSIIKALPDSDPPCYMHMDYVDDLESFYYVLAYICTTFSGPRTQLAPANIPSSIKNIWFMSEDGSLSSQISKASLLEKEGNLKNFKFGVGCGCLTPYFSTKGKIFELLLQDLHCVVRYRYMRKVAGEGYAAVASPESLNLGKMWTLLKEESEDDYYRFKASIDFAVKLLDANDNPT